MRDDVDGGWNVIKIRIKRKKNRSLYIINNCQKEKYALEKTRHTGNRNTSNNNS